MPASVLGQSIATALRGALGNAQATYSPGTPAQASVIIAGEITKYLLSNSTVITAYVGTIPGPPPAPEAGSGVHPVSGAVAPPTGSTIESWLDSLGTGIASGFVTLPSPSLITPMAPHLSFQVPETRLSVFCPKSVLGGAHEGAWSDPMIPVWTKIAEAVFQMITSQVSQGFPASLLGTGVATVTKLELI